VANVSIRTVRLDDWDQELATIQRLHQATLPNLFQRASLTEAEFRRLAGQIRPFLDPDLALIAEVVGEPVGFLIAVPDINRALIQIDGRLFPWGWLKLRRAMQKVDVVTFKMVGVREEYRRRGIDALLYLEAVKVVYDKGYAWLDGSVSSERNPMINRIAERLGAELYKHYRMYEMEL
jgi:GNAT superfamily N-acetyltransferase